MASVKPDGLSAGEYATLVLILAGAIIATAMFVTWAAEQRGMLAPAGTPSTAHPSMGAHTDGLDATDYD